MRILVAGAGATGGYFGARLAQAGRDVTFLVRPGRAAQLERDGLRIVSPHGDLTLKPQLLVTGEATAPFDVVIPAVKAYALDQALADLAPAIGAETMIVPLLNGMRHIDRLIERFGEAPVLGGVCLVATTLDQEGRIVQLAEMQELAYGERSLAVSERVRLLDETMQGAGFKARRSETILQDMWEKWTMLATAGGVTCLLRGNVGEIEAVPSGAVLALQFLEEAIAVAAASGFAPRDAFLARARGVMTAKGSGFASSMYRDMQGGLPVEVDHILGDMLHRAQGFGLATPLLAAATAQLRIYQSRRAPGEPVECACPAWEGPCMNVLLLSMPDSFEHMPVRAVRMPNGALTSLASNVDDHHRVAVADLILVQDRVEQTVRRLVRERDPAVVGLSVMTFQRETAFAVMAMLRALKPDVRIVVGGYDPSLAREEYFESAADFIVRGEGEVTFRELLRAVERGDGYQAIDGLSWRAGDGWRHNRNRGLADPATIKPPNRAARVLSGYTINGRQVDVIETSRGCTFDCSFCSIIEMRGRNFNRFAIERVIADIADAHAQGARAIFLVDDNIVLDVKRVTALCEAIIAAGLQGIDYTVQAMTSTIADHGATLAPLMRRAGFRYVFLGIENVLPQDLGFLRAESKNTKRTDGRRTGNAALDAIAHIRGNGMFVVGGLIVGNPGDTRDDVETNLEFARRSVDWPYIQHPTPYPGTPMTADLRRQGLIAIDDVAQYDGTTAVVRNETMELREIEFLRWRAERWMKVRHMPAMLRHDPLFSLLHGPALLRHTFRGSSLRSLLGLEDERAAFARYCALRQAEREYVPKAAKPALTRRETVPA